MIAITILKPKQEKLLLAMLTQPNLTKAIEEAGISKKTAYKYQSDPVFKTEYLKQRKEIMSRVTGLLQQASADGVKILYDIAKDTNQPAHARVQAVRTILEYAYKGIELEEIQTRLEEVERRLEDE